MNFKLIFTLLTLVSLAAFAFSMWAMFYFPYPHYWLIPTFIWGFNLANVGGFTLVNWRDL